MTCIWYNLNAVKAAHYFDKIESIMHTILDIRMKNGETGPADQTTEYLFVTRLITSKYPLLQFRVCVHVKRPETRPLYPQGSYYPLPSPFARLSQEKTKGTLGVGGQSAIWVRNRKLCLRNFLLDWSFGRKCRVFRFRQGLLGIGREKIGHHLALSLDLHVTTDVKYVFGVLEMSASSRD